jgi:sulfite reductase (NADPH) flavoprotein alpha-component
MVRALHLWLGLLALILTAIVGLSGAGLAIFPAAERLTAPQADATLSVAELADRIRSAYPGVEQIRRAPSGRIIAYWFDDGVPGAAVIDPATGFGVASADPNQTERWLTNLHRSLFLGDSGRIAVAAAAAAMLVLSLSGTALIARRTGGWRRWFARLKGPLAGRIHVEIGRVAVAGLVLSSATGLWMAASTFELLPAESVRATPPSETSGTTGIELGSIAILRDNSVADLRDLSFPEPGDATDVFKLTTDRGTGYLDQGTGALLLWADRTPWERVFETVHMLHTGRGAAVLGLVLGLMALGVPAMGATGAMIWYASWRARPRIVGNRPARTADTIVLVGSEGGSTWGFAATLHAALTKAGYDVHVGRMSDFVPRRYAHAARFVVLAATYGDGAAPASASGFLDRLAAAGAPPSAPLAVLGFGDRSFPRYCAFASAVAAAAKSKGWPELLAFNTVDRQSPQDFARWGRALGRTLGIDLELAHRPARPTTTRLTLVSRRDYGAEVGAPTSILRFALPPTTLWQRIVGAGFARFEAGDLIGVLPGEGALPRLYSLASSRADGFLEIVVKRQPGGVCSERLTGLTPGEAVAAFLRRNPGFHAPTGRTPLILIGAGTGIGPLAGFVRENDRRRPIHLFFGIRRPDSDYLYGEELSDWQNAGHVTGLNVAASRSATSRYVQDALRDDAVQVKRLIRDDARIMVCGGRAMAAGVEATLAEILVPTGLTPAILKAEGRYVEDVY